MRKPSLTLETFLTALAVVGAGASAGCSKAPAPGRVTAEPPAAAPAAPAAPPPNAPVAAPPAAAEAVPVATAVGATAVDAGKPAVKKGDTKGQMSCGAGGCSPDMKKGTGN
jgi:hypothetical protein